MTIDLVGEVKRRLEESFALDRFVVFLHPSYEDLDTVAAPALEQRGLETCSLVDLFSLDDQRFVLAPNDTHLSPEGNRAVAAAMTRYLVRPRAASSCEEAVGEVRDILGPP
jgi:hypothetical protein